MSHSIKKIVPMKARKIVLVCVLLFSLFTYECDEAMAMDAAVVIWPFTKKKQPKDSIPAKENAYDKLFKGKKSVKKVKGLMTLHQVEDKLYLEIPLGLVGSDLMLSSQLEEVSDISVLHVGQRASGALFFSIEKQDSTLLLLRKNGLAIEPPEENPRVKEAIAKSNIPSVIFKTTVLAFSEDSASVVVDGTPFFLGDNNFITSFTLKPKKEKSHLCDIAAFEDNVSVYSGMTFEEKGQLLSFVVKTTIYRLPDQKMNYMMADHRIGVNTTVISCYDNAEQGIRQKQIVRRWNLQPSDKAKHESGQLVTPVKPITFHVDTLFSEECFNGIKLGFEKWNEAFEAIGFRQVIQVLPYPKNDSLFNANDNIKYNCIKYVQTNRMDISRSITRNILSDPRSGEIISVSLYFPRDAFIPIHYNRVIQTGHVDVTVRGNRLTKEQMIESVAAMMMKQAGYCLGLTDNLAASSWFDVDSLRSPSFTRENGLTASVMDDVIYNYVARPGDLERGVKLVTSDLGVYDHYAIGWLYGKKDDQERSAWIDAHQNDPRYLYIGRHKTGQVAEDPRAIAGSLGNDVLKSVPYGLANCKYAMENYIDWIDRPGTSDSYKMLFSEFIFLETLAQLRHLINSLGGIHVDNTANRESFGSVPSGYQREVLKRLLEEVANINWMNNGEAFKRSGVFFTDMTNPLIATPIVQLFNRVPLVSVSAELSTGDNPFTPDDLMRELTAFVTRGFRKPGPVSLTDKRMLEWTVRSFASSVEKSIGTDQKSEKQSSLTLEDFVGKENPLDEMLLLASSLSAESGWELDQPGLNRALDIHYAAVPDLTALFYRYLKEINAALKYKRNITSDELLKGFCNYYSYQIENVLKGEKFQ